MIFQIRFWHTEIGTLLKSLSKAAVMGLASLVMFGLAADVRPVRAAEPIKVGVLHSLTGTMAISETTLRDVMLMLIAEQNARGGVLGRKLEAVVVDPASDWPTFAAKARELITTHKVAAVFGCWTSASRKAVLPVFKELNSLLFYPVQYEGQESERNVFYLGAAPNQQAIPAVDYLAVAEKIERWALIGTDYVYPRTTNRILEAYLKSKGVAATDIMVRYTPFGHKDWAGIINEVRAFAKDGNKTAVISTVNGDANVGFYQELARQGISAFDTPVMAFSVGEEELSRVDPKPLVGHYAAWNYFQSVPSAENREFVKRWRTHTGSAKRVTNDPMEAHVIGFEMWVKAVERAGTTATDKVIAAIKGVEVFTLSGAVARMLPNHHVTKPVMIGRVRSDGQFDIVWQTDNVVPGDAWSDHLDESKYRDANWAAPASCGNLDTRTGICQR